MTYIPYLGTFFFSRYPSVALARNMSGNENTQLLPICISVLPMFDILCIIVYIFCIVYTFTLYPSPSDFVRGALNTAYTLQ